MKKLEKETGVNRANGERKQERIEQTNKKLEWIEQTSEKTGVDRSNSKR